MLKCGKTFFYINKSGTEGFVDPIFTNLTYKVSNQRHFVSKISRGDHSNKTYKDQYNDYINFLRNSSVGSQTVPKTSVRESESAIIEASDLSNDLKKLNLRATTADKNVSKHSSTKSLWRTFDVKNKKGYFFKTEEFNDNQFKMCRAHNGVDILSDVLSWRHFRWKHPEITVCIMNSTKISPTKRAVVRKSQAYNDERNRLLTFAKYPRNAEKSAISLAANGFIFEGSSKRDAKIKCAFCGKELPVWKLKSTWKNIHKRTCPMRDNNNSLNVPLNLNTSHLSLQTLNKNIQRSTNKPSLLNKHLSYMRTNVLQWANKSFVTASSIAESALVRHRITGRCVQETGQPEVLSSLGSLMATNLNSCPEITSIEESRIQEYAEASSNNQCTLTGSNLQHDDIRTTEAMRFETIFETPEFINAPVAAVPEGRTANAAENNNAYAALKQDLHTSLEHPEINLPTSNITSTFQEINLPTSNITSTFPEINLPISNITSTFPEINLPTSNITTFPEINLPTSNITSTFPEIILPASNKTSKIPKINVPTSNITTFPEINLPTSNITSTFPEINLPASNITSTFPEINLPTSNITSTFPEIIVPTANTSAFPEIIVTTANTSTIPEINAPTANRTSAIPELNAPEPLTTSTIPEINAPEPLTTSTIAEINAPETLTTSTIAEINAPTANITFSIPEINAPTANTTSAIPEINAPTGNTTSVSGTINTAPTANERLSPGTIPQARPGSGRDPTYEELGIITERPKRPEYALTIKRLETFVSWPRDHHLSPDELVDAGFYYAGYGDCTRCFYCGGGLRNWEEDDNVWVEHARWFSKCAFLRQKMGQVFVNTVQGMNTEYDKITIAMVFDRLGVPSSTFQLDTLNTPLKRDAAVRSLISLGYQESDVLVIAHLIKQEGNILSSDSLLQRLVQEEKRPLKPHAVTLLSTMNTTQALESIQVFKERNNQLRQQTCCKICMDKEVAVVFLPCGHLISCAECASAMRNCPLCRQGVRGIVRAFMC